MMGQFLFRRNQTGALVAATALMVGVFAPAAHAQDAVSTQTEVMGALELTKTADLDFGQLIVPRNGRVDMTAAANAVCTPNNTLIHTGVCQAAAFDGRAPFGQNIEIVLPVGRRLELTGPGVDLRIRRLDIGGTTGLQSQGRTGRTYRYNVTAADGNFDFHIGARVLLRNNQATGVYDGTFSITLDYQ